MPEVHATLSASGAHRWLNCTASPSLEAGLPSTAGEAAAEGTRAHSMAEAKLRARLTGETYTGESSGEMGEATDAYVDLVTTIATGLSPADVAVEQRVDFDHLVPGGFGTADCVILSDKVLHIVDLKYGMGVRVEAEGNPQLRLYALGALAEFGILYDFETVRMTIFQPRLDSTSTAEMTRAELEEWGETVVAPAARAADAGQGEFRPGEWCRWCKAKAICRARAEENLALARLEFAPAPTLEPEEVASVVEQAGRLASWAKDVESWAKDRLKEGTEMPGLKLIAGRGRRSFTDADRVATVASEAGYTTHEMRLLPLTSIEKQMGKKTFAELLGDLVTKTEGEPQLVAASDPRPAWTPVTAETEFTKEN